jgi:hypothetical protein
MGAEELFIGDERRTVNHQPMRGKWRALGESNPSLHRERVPS